MLHLRSALRAFNQFTTLAVYMAHFLRFGWMGLVVFMALSAGLIAQSSNPVGHAFQNGQNCYTITPNSPWQLGAVWFNEQISFAQSFEITLTVGLGSNPSGADGIVMVFQQVGINAIGTAGGGLGFSGFLPSLGIEIDTFTNLELGDPGNDHIAILRDGNTFHTNAFNLAGPVNAIASGATMSDGQDHIFQVRWNAQTTTLQVYIDCQLRLTYTGSIVQNIFSGNPFVYWGFTGATGGLTNLQTACIDTFADGLPSAIDICSGESLQLGVVGSPAGSYAWSPTTFLDDPASPTPFATPENDITYTVTYTDVCGNPSIQTTEINVVSVNLELVESISICEGETAEVSAVGNAANYQWSDGQTSANGSFESTGTYTLIATTGDCSAQASVDVSVNANPSVDLDEIYAFCQGESVEFTIAPVNTNTATWSNGTNGFSTVFTDPGNAGLTLTNSANCTTDYAFTLIEILLPIGQLPESLSLCDGEGELLSPGVANAYTWSNGSSQSTLSVDSAGTYSVTMSNGGCSIELTTEVSVAASPQFNFSSEFDLCQDSTLVQSLPDLAYDFTLNGILVNDTLRILQPGAYLLTAIDWESGCSTVQTFTVEQRFAPRASLPENVHLCELSSVILDPGNTAFETASVWNTGADTGLLTVLEPGIYSVELTNLCGSANAVTEVEVVACDCPVFVPNAFTPDLDDLNEVFFPVVSCDVKDYSFAVYDRWGELLFLTGKVGEGWNGGGRAGTHYVEGEVYLWKLQFKADLPGATIVVDRIGHVVVLR